MSEQEKNAQQPQQAVNAADAATAEAQTSQADEQQKADNEPAAENARAAQSEPAGEHVDRQATDGDSEDAAEPTVASLTAELATLRAELTDTGKALAEADLRAQAEIQNMRRRMEREVGNAHKYALEKFAADLLAVADNLERGLAAVPADDDSLQAIREGMTLTLKSLTDVFARQGIEALDPQGAQFDPQWHEAMTMVPMPDAEPNSVVEVLEKGYALNGRLIRPARVVVAKNT